jgi:hypothetical protein
MQKYVTRGVINEISLPCQILIWELSESLPIEKDYLQVFILTPGIEGGKAIQNITQKQEQPEFWRSYSFFCEEPVSAKLFLIRDGDDGDSGNSIQKLLLAREY